MIYCVSIPYRHVINDIHTFEPNGDTSVSIPYRHVINRIHSHCGMYGICVSIPYRHVINLYVRSFNRGIVRVFQSPIGT